MHQQVTGLTTGEFDKLSVYHNGSMQDITTLLGTGGGGGSVTSTAAPLNLNGGQLDIDLSNYSTTTQINNKLATKQDPLTAGSNITMPIM